MVVSVLLCGAGASAALEEPPEPMTNGDVITLVSLGVIDDVITGMIAQRPSAFALGATDLQMLRASGVSEATIAAMLKTRRGTLKVETEPSGVTVRVAGRRVGNTPVVADLAPGEYIIVLEKNGYSSQEWTATIAVGAQATVSTTMESSDNGPVVVVPPPEAVEAANSAASGAFRSGGASGGSRLPLILGLAGGGAAAVVVASGDNDKDDDGFSADEGDCNDDDPTIHPNGSVRAMTARFVSAQTTCPRGAFNLPHTRAMVVDFLNNSCSSVSITSVTSKLTVRATNNTQSSVGRTATDSSADYSPHSIAPGSTATIRVVHGGLFCSNVNFSGTGFIEFEGEVTLRTTSGRFVVRTSNRNRTVFPLQTGQVTGLNDGAASREISSSFARQTTRQTTGDSVARSIALSSHLDLAGAQAEIQIDEDGVIVPQGVTRLSVRSQGGERTVRGRLASGSAPGTWRFDFQGSDGFDPSSIQIREGNAVQVSAHAVVFQLEGRPGERIAFTFRHRK